MSFFGDPTRQLFLLLWKNFTLRKRNKLRMLIELLWPLFLFIILVWVRTRGLRDPKSQCHYTERPLPSGGILPFLRTYICELNNSCSNVPRNSYYNFSFLQFVQNGSNFLNSVSQSNFVQLVQLTVQLINLFNNSTFNNNVLAATRNISLNESLIQNGISFKPTLNSYGLLPNPINKTIEDLILTSSPNFNYLYSNFSIKYQDDQIFSQLPTTLSAIVYGADLNNLDSNRNSNQVYNATWLRTQMCSPNTNYLLRGSVYLNDYLCNKLNSSQLVNLFVTISSQIDFTAVRAKARNSWLNFSNFNSLNSQNTSVNDFIQVLNANQSTLTGIYDNFQSFLNSIVNFNLSSICDSGSQLNIFNFFNLNQVILNTQPNYNISYLNITLINSTSNNQTIKSNETKSSDSLIGVTSIFKILNNLNNLPESECPSSSQTDPLIVNSTTQTCFCNVILNTVSKNNSFISMILNQLLPIFQGKILYSPNTTVYNNLIQTMNATFASFDAFGDSIVVMANLVDQLILNINQSRDSYQLLLNLIQMNNSLNLEQVFIDLEFTSQLLRFVRNSINCFELNRFIGYATENEAVDVGARLQTQNALWAVLIFQNSSDGQNILPKIVNYKIRMSSQFTHDTNYAQSRSYTFGQNDCLGCNPYFLYGFIYIQDMLERAIIISKTNLTYPMGINTQMTPYPCYVNDRFSTAIANSLPLFMVLAWIYTVSMLVKDIVYEKEKRLKEFMRVMGLTNTIHWLAWLITSFLAMYFVCIILCLIIKYGQVVTYSDLSVLLVFFFCFSIATISQCFLISVFFNQANLASVVAGIIYFLLYLPYTVVNNYSDVMPIWQKFLACLSSTVAFGFGFQIIGAYEISSIGVQWSNIGESPYASENQLNLISVCFILLFDAFVYMMLTLYIEQIAPGEFGIPQPWYFVISPKYWLGDFKFFKKLTENTNRNKRLKLLCAKLFASFDFKQKIILEEDQRDELKKRTNEAAFNYSIENLEQETSLVAGIEIDKLHKVYSRGNNHAVKGLSVKFYENEITAFLGHNGAGKSTTMHMLTGLYKPTSGSAKINGLSISDSMNKIRKSLGFVPQHNILFPLLTVKEHLWFYARLKGLDRLETKSEMTKLLEDTGLEPKKDAYSSKLSGGMQRKLSVAIAFVGGSKTVILDEPSAGVDPQGRRSIWDLLFKYKHNRTIIISTHHLDEADVLGDRIAIISNGKLVAHGTSFFLKNNFGRGYYLTFAKKIKSNDDDNASNASLGSGSSDSGITSLSSNSSTVQLNKTTVRPATSTRLQTIRSNDNIPTVYDELQSLEETLRENELKILKAMKDPQDLKIDDFIKSRFTNAILVENIGTEMTYSISNRVEHTKNYEKYFFQLEKNAHSLGIDSMGISDTTLEEIFIRLAHEPEINEFKRKNLKLCGINLTAIGDKLFGKCIEPISKKNAKLSDEKLKEYSKLTKLRLKDPFSMMFLQLYALIVKRLHRVKRNVKGFFAEIVLPVLFVCLALIVATLTPNDNNRPPLELHPWYYTAQNQMFLSKSSSLQYENTFYSADSNAKVVEQYNSSFQSNIDQVNRIVDTFSQNASIGTRCVKNYKIRITSQSFAFRYGNSYFDCNTPSTYSNLSQPSVSFQNELNLVNYTYSKCSLSCDCSSGRPSCPASAGGDINYRSIKSLKTSDLLYDLTSRNITDWLIKTEFSNQFFKKRYGGFEFMPPLLTTNQLMNFSASLTNFLNTFTSNSISSSNSNPILINQIIKIWYNLKGYVSSVSYLNVINNAILRSQINKLNEETSNTNLDPNEHAIVAYNHPMPYTKLQFIDILQKRLIIDLFVAICIIFALSFIPASFLVFILEERENHSKQLQFVSGVRPYIYWTSNYVWDLINYIVPCLLCILIFIIFNVQTYMSSENFPCLILLMLLYGWSCIPLMYPLNYLFEIPSTAFVVSSSLNVFIGTITTLATTVLTQLGDKDLLQINDILKPLFIVLFPHYCLGQGFIQMSILYNTQQVSSQYGIAYTYNIFSMENNGRNLLAMFFQGVFFNLLNLLIQYKFFIRFKPNKILKESDLVDSSNLSSLDDDVAAEQIRIQNVMNKNTNSKKRFNFFSKRDKVAQSTINQPTEEKPDHQNEKDYVKLVNLSKIFKKFKLKKFKQKKHLAVNNLSLGISKGECFGLIGVNGAGKTTTFKMITGEMDITAGDVYVGEYSVSKEIEEVHKNIGYCPQFDAIMPLLTAREHLILFARLRGIPDRYVNKVAEWAMNRVGLHVFADRMSGDFSGGNKRKLSTAIALIGDPSLICLDEPTSGMDAKARRLLWNDILSLIKENRIVILTSHSMEECEALCTRLVIMVNGQFKCLGSPQHLKRKFGNGYKLAVRIYNENDKQLFFDFMRTQFPFSTIQESHKNLFEYILPFESTKLSDIFGKLEKNRDQLKIKDYSVSQTTLDQIFVNFAKNQSDQDPFTDEYRPIDAFQPSTPISNPLEINSNELFQQHDVINNVIQVEQVEEKKRINDNTLQQSHNELNREDEPQKEIETERSFSFRPNKSPSNPSLSSTSSSSSALPQQVNFNIEPLIFNNDISDKDRTQIIETKL